MSKITKCEVVQRAWNMLRLSVSWARKNGVFRRRTFAVELRLVRKFIKRLGLNDDSTPRLQPHYCERQFSFDETPIFNVKMHRPTATRFHFPHIPCINPKVDFDFDFDFDSCVDDEEEGIDLRAEKFINKFYEEMKMQGQVSYLQYNEISDE